MEGDSDLEQEDEDLVRLYDEEEKEEEEESDSADADVDTTLPSHPAEEEEEEEEEAAATESLTTSSTAVTARAKRPPLTERQKRAAALARYRKRLLSLPVHTMEVNTFDLPADEWTDEAERVGTLAEVGDQIGMFHLSQTQSACSRADLDDVPVYSWIPAGLLVDPRLQLTVPGGGDDPEQEEEDLTFWQRSSAFLQARPKIDVARRDYEERLEVLRELAAKEAAHNAAIDQRVAARRAYAASTGRRLLQDEGEQKRHHYERLYAQLLKKKPAPVPVVVETNTTTQEENRMPLPRVDFHDLRRRAKPLSRRWTAAQREHFRVQEKRLKRAYLTDHAFFAIRGEGVAVVNWFGEHALWPLAFHLALRQLYQDERRDVYRSTMPGFGRSLFADDILCDLHNQWAYRRQHHGLTLHEALESRARDPRRMVADLVKHELGTGERTRLNKPVYLLSSSLPGRELVEEELLSVLRSTLALVLRELREASMEEHTQWFPHMDQVHLVLKTWAAARLFVFEFLQTTQYEIMARQPIIVQVVPTTAPPSVMALGVGLRVWQSYPRGLFVRTAPAAQLLLLHAMARALCLGYTKPMADEKRRYDQWRAKHPRPDLTEQDVFESEPRAVYQALQFLLNLAERAGVLQDGLRVPVSLGHYALVRYEEEDDEGNTVMREYTRYVDDDDDDGGEGEPIVSGIWSYERVDVLRTLESSVLSEDKQSISLFETSSRRRQRRGAKRLPPPRGPEEEYMGDTPQGHPRFVAMPLGSWEEEPPTFFLS